MARGEARRNGVVKYVGLMAWEWVGPTAGLVVGLVGIGAGQFTLWRTQRHTEVLARVQHHHEHGRWHRDRRADAYISTLEVAGKVGHWVANVHPMVGRGQDVDLPEVDMQVVASARLEAFGSKGVRVAEQEWRSVVWEAIRAAEDISRGSEERRRDLEEIRAREVAARRALIDAINDDLRIGPLLRSEIDD